MLYVVIFQADQSMILFIHVIDNIIVNSSLNSSHWLLQAASSELTQDWVESLKAGGTSTSVSLMNELGVRLVPLAPLVPLHLSLLCIWRAACMFS